MAHRIVDKRNTILTHTGQLFDFNNPSFTEDSIHDIAYALSNLCRFTGHCKEFYSVAQHSVLVAEQVEETRYHQLNKRASALAGLMHDATEAYLGDIPGPLKAMLPDYKAAEAKVERALFEFFGIPYCQFQKDVKEAEGLVFAREFAELFTHDQELGRAARIRTIMPWPPKTAERAFLEVFASLTE